MPEKDLPMYRVFFPGDEIPDMPAGAKVEEAYPAFVMVRASEEAVEVLRKRYPLEAVKPPRGASFL